LRNNFIRHEPLRFFGAQMTPRARLTALIEGSLAANIFDWGAAACVELYHNGAALANTRAYSCTSTCMLPPMSSLAGS
jgi:hypothetical protein